jgi:hypothetical protein
MDPNSTSPVRHTASTPVKGKGLAGGGADGGGTNCGGADALPGLSVRALHRMQNNAPGSSAIPHFGQLNLVPHCMQKAVPPADSFPQRVQNIVLLPSVGLLFL